jgi:hypothetical protein
MLDFPALGVAFSGAFDKLGGREGHCLTYSPKLSFLHCFLCAFGLLVFHKDYCPEHNLQATTSARPHIPNLIPAT